MSGDCAFAVEGEHLQPKQTADQRDHVKLSRIKGEETLWLSKTICLTLVKGAATTIIKLLFRNVMYKTYFDYLYG